MDASVKSILPPRFWSVGVVFAAFFGLLTVASKCYGIFSLTIGQIFYNGCQSLSDLVAARYRVVAADGRESFANLFAYHSCFLSSISRYGNKVRIRR